MCLFLVCAAQKEYFFYSEESHHVMGLSQTQSCCPFFSGTRNLGVFYLCTSFIVFGAPDGDGGWFRFALRGGVHCGPLD